MTDDKTTIATLTSQLAEARAMAGAAREQTIAALHGPLWRAILQTEDCMNRVCSYRTEAGGCLCGPKIDRIEAHVRTLIPDMAAAIAERDAEIARLTARAEAAEAMADRLADAARETREAILRLQSKWRADSGWAEVTSFAATYADDDGAPTTEALAAHAAMKEGR